MNYYTEKTYSKNTKVLFLLHLPPPVHGSSLVGQWIYDSKKINSAFSCSYINLLASKNVNENRKITLKKIFDFVVVWFQLFKLLLKNRYNLCYMALTTNGPAFYRDVLLIILLKTFGIKRVYHLHNKGVKNFSRHGINKVLYQFIFKNSNTIILSERLYTDIQEFVPKSQVHICANGIPDKQIKKASSQTKNRLTKILFLSNLIETKGVFILLQALKILKDRKINFEAFFVGGEGDISEGQLNDKINEFGLQSNVKYLGKKYGDDKEAIFDLADIFTFPTYYPDECFPLVILEAMQSGLPVISTFEGGIPDIVENNVTGYLVSQQNPIELAQKIELLCHDEKLRKKLGVAGRIKFEKNYSLIKFENTLTKILKDVIY